MKFPNHIVLAVSKPNISTSSQYWVSRYLISSIKNIFFLSSFNTNRTYLTQKNKIMFNCLTENQNKLTIKYSLVDNFFFLSETNKNFYSSFFKTNPKIKNKDFLNKNFDVKQSNSTFDEKYLNFFLLSLKYNQTLEIFKNNKLWSLFDFNFLKKERIYTKLKYSRVPQYDIVSGGVAAIFAGFLGFLISEKFGIELVDSGDFYFLFMYVVFLCFFLRLFLKIMDNSEISWNVVSLKWSLYYYQNILKLLFHTFYSFFKSVK